MNPMPKYDYSRVPPNLLATYARAHVDPAFTAEDFSAAYDAVQAAARVPERTRAELGELVIGILAWNLCCGETGMLKVSDEVGDQIRALVNEARTAPR